MLLSDKICVVTGAASQRGIGLATARLFAEHGGRSSSSISTATPRRRRPPSSGDAHLGFACDVTDKAACEAAARQVVDEFGQVDVLVNNAGITQPVKTHGDRRPRTATRSSTSTCAASLYLSQAFIPHMRARKPGSIACMSSVSAQRGGGIFGGPHYSAAKAGVLGLAKAMARELGPDGIRVNCVTPGLIQTDITGGKLTDEMKRGDPEGHPARTGSATPTTWPASTCSWPPTSPPTSPAP